MLGFSGGMWVVFVGVFFVPDPKLQCLSLLCSCACSLHLNKQSFICGSLGIHQDSLGKKSDSEHLREVWAASMHPCFLPK